MYHGDYRSSELKKIYVNYYGGHLTLENWGGGVTLEIKGGSQRRKNLENWKNQSVFWKHSEAWVLVVVVAGPLKSLSEEIIFLFLIKVNYLRKEKDLSLKKGILKLFPYFRVFCHLLQMFPCRAPPSCKESFDVIIPVYFSQTASSLKNILSNDGGRWIHSSNVNWL